MRELGNEEDGEEQNLLYTFIIDGAKKKKGHWQLLVPRQAAPEASGQGGSVVAEASGHEEAIVMVDRPGVSGDVEQTAMGVAVAIGN
eukprot:9507952-Karenia_brevis.AAC.1